MQGQTVCQCRTHCDALPRVSAAHCSSGITLTNVLYVRATGSTPCRQCGHAKTAGTPLVITTQYPPQASSCPPALHPSLTTCCTLLHHMTPCSCCCCTSLLLPCCHTLERMKGSTCIASTHKPSLPYASISVFCTCAATAC